MVSKSLPPSINSHSAEMRPEEKEREGQTFFLVCIWKGRLYIVGRTGYKLQRKGDLGTLITSSLFPSSLFVVLLSQPDFHSAN